MIMRGVRAVVTGAAGGLGSLVASRLLGDGAIVATVDRHSMPSGGGSEWHVCADLSQNDGVRSAVEVLSRRLPEVDLLVNCAGVFVPDPSHGGEWDALDHLWRHNTASTVMFTLALEPLLAKGMTPSVVNIGSTDGIVASGGQDCEIGVRHDVLYALTKGAIIAFTRALAMKWAPLGIRVNTICPTIFDSPMTETLLDVAKRGQLGGYIPLGRLATKEDIADAIIAAHGMRFTTGHMFPVDGGYLCQ